MGAAEPFLHKTEDGFQVRYKGRNLYASSTPQKSAEERALRIPLTPSTLVIVPSPLLGYGIEVLLNRLSGSSYVLTVETDRVLYEFSRPRISTILSSNKNIGLYKFDSIEDILHTVLKIGLHRFRKCILLPLSGGYSLNAPRYRSLLKAIEKEINLYWQNNLTLIKMGRLWIKNIIKNLKYLSSSAMFGDFTINKPIVIAGAGESLERGLQIIRNYRDRFFLACADTAAPAIAAAGVHPDLIISLESQFANLKDFIPLGQVRHALLADITSYPQVMRRAGTKQRYLFSSQFRKNALLSRLEKYELLPPLLEPLGSVGVAAYVLITSISDLPVFLTGLDFSYVTGKPHARGCPSHIDYLAGLSRTAFPALYAACLARPRIAADSACGGGIQSDLVLLSYAEQLRPYLQGNTNVFLLAGGIDLSLPLIRSENEFTAALDAVATHDAAAKAEKPVKATGSSTTATGRRNRACVIEFIKSEIEQLNASLEAIHAFINVSNDERDALASNKDYCPEQESSVLHLLEKTDYLYIDFPDPPPLPNTSISFLRRCIGAARYYRTLFEQSLDELSGEQ